MVIHLPANEIKETSRKSLEKFKDKSVEETVKLLDERKSSKPYSSRILNIGIYLIISQCKDFEETIKSDISQVISDIFEKLNLSVSKAEKDIGIYKTSIKKMEQAKELIEELRIKGKKDAK